VNDPRRRFAPTSPKWALSIGMAGRFRSERVAAFIGMRTQRVSTVIPGMASREEVEENLRICETPSLLCEDEKILVQRVADAMRGVHCRRCQYCEPCPEGVPISTILRLLKYHHDYGLHAWAKEQYRALPISGQACVACRQCETRCPYEIEISAEMRTAVLLLGLRDIDR